MTTKKESATYTNKRAIHIASYSVHLGIWIKARLWCIQMCIEWHWTSINILKPFARLLQASLTLHFRTTSSRHIEIWWLHRQLSWKSKRKRDIPRHRITLMLKLHGTLSCLC